MIKRLHRSLAAVVALSTIGLAGCGSDGALLSQSKQPPDEFAVFSRAPLSMPRDYGLRPPGPGASGNQALVEPRDTARATLTGISRPGTPAAGALPPGAALPDASPGVAALLNRTGGATASPEIRAQVNRETTILADADQSFLERLMFWRDPQDRATVVDPAAETRRIQEQQALGEPLTTGETPTIGRRERALLEGIFD